MKSDTEMCVLGFNAAGWSQLTKQEEEAGKTIYGFGKTPVESTNSFYNRAHPKDRPMSQLKEKFLQKYAAMEIIDNFDTALNLEEKNKLISAYNKYWKDTSALHGSLRELDGSEPLKVILKRARCDCLVFLQCLVSGEVFDKDAKPLTESVTKLAPTHPWMEDRLAETVNMKFQSLQDTMWASKCVIADVFQENVRRQAKGEPLIPIKIVVSQERAVDDKQAEFQPSVDNMRMKADCFITPTELRMIYKLSHELPDKYKEQMQMMRDLVSFLKRDSQGAFVGTTAPWDTSQDEWPKRPRGQRGECKESYKDRVDLPKWLDNILKNRGEVNQTWVATENNLPDGFIVVKRQKGG